RSGPRSARTRRGILRRSRKSAALAKSFTRHAARNLSTAPRGTSGPGGAAGRVSTGRVSVGGVSGVVSGDAAHAAHAGHATTRQAAITHRGSHVMPLDNRG